MSLLMKAILTFLAIARLSAAWEVSSYLVVTSVTTGLLPDYNVTETVTLTGPLTITPIATSTVYRTTYFPVTKSGAGAAVVNVTTKEFRLPTSVDLPTAPSDAPDSELPEPTIVTAFYVPAIVTNPSTCTLTQFSYTESIGIGIPTQFREQATNPDLVELVTTYISTISTNLGGQAVTTSRCDVYFKSDAIPVIEGGIRFNGNRYITECVDPRPTLCTGEGETVGTGTLGCKGAYPPTATAENEEGPPPSSSEDPESSASWNHGGGLWGVQQTWLVVAIVCSLVLTF
ncbi:hypothetical protein HJFPF1_11895 [Paramyrothecium foliicola]|nr:hypothetical protein HJFPF1_11895 [Paramyrothecium foliicola]